MINEEGAIKAAVDYLKQLPAELLGNPKDIRLETIQSFDDEWIVVLSYLSERDLGLPVTDSPLARALSTVRRSKEFSVAVKSGKVTGMTMPHAHA
jgi:hypothetical protein